MLTHLHQFAIPAAYAVLPPAMASPRATAMLLAIALQESRCRHRRQMGGGPARGLYQFERNGGTAGVIVHPTTRPIIGAALQALCYPVFLDACFSAIEHNDVLASAFARCLLWTDPAPLPGADDPAAGWALYLRTWRPGRPHETTWRDHFQSAWQVVDSPIMERN
ncbi:MAG TPA: hypothetical protein VNJ02_10510 [Vicinamibacterales bacterium]|nr:hypothetical protein [Vicinamibacterales bacterium]